MFRNIYHDFCDGRSVDCWNAVDMKRDDGHLQHGRVVDVLSAGILVDFGYSGQREHFIPYGQAFQFPEKNKFQWCTDIPVGSEVIALLREQSDGPWIWYPGKLLAIFPSLYMHIPLVGLEMCGVYREEIVPAEQLRMPPSPADLQANIIQAGCFNRRVCALPDCGGWTSTADEVVKTMILRILSQTYEAHPIHLSKKHLVYFQRATATALDSNSLKMVIDSAQRDIMWHKEAYGLHFLGDGWRCGTLFRTVLAVTNSEEWGVQNLANVAKDILGEVFQYATSMERVQYRRVSPQFNLIINNAARFTDIVIRLRNCPAGNYLISVCRQCGSQGREYSVVAPLVKCMTSYTQCIIITAEHKTEDFFAVPFLLDALQGLRKLGRTDQRSLAVVAGKCSFFGGGGHFRFDVEDLAKNLQAANVCNKLFLYDCCVNHYVLELDVSVMRINGTVKTSSAEKDFWDVVESGLPTVDIQPICEWVSRAVLEQSNDRARIAYILNVFIGDPRPSSVYRGQEWTVDNLGALDVAKLSALCRYVLSLNSPPSGPDTDQLPPFAEDA